MASDSSSLSNSSYDTSSTSPISLKASLAQKVASLQPPSSQIERPVTPEIRNALKDSASEGASSVSTSPMSVDSQTLKHGSKRTASGAVKPPMNMMESTSVVEYSRHTTPKLDASRARSSSRAAEVGILFRLLCEEAISIKLPCFTSCRSVFYSEEPRKPPLRKANNVPRYLLN